MGSKLSQNLYEVAFGYLNPYGFTCTKQFHILDTYFLMYEKKHKKSDQILEFKCDIKKVLSPIFAIISHMAVCQMGRSRLVKQDFD